MRPTLATRAPPYAYPYPYPYPYPDPYPDPDPDPVPRLLPLSPTLLLLLRCATYWLAATNRAPSYVYQFSQTSRATGLALHGYEIRYVFG